MSTIDDFTDSDSSRSTADPFEGDRDNRPDVKRKHGVRSSDGSTLYGMIGRDRERGTTCYTSPRERDANYYRAIGGYPIGVDTLEKLRNPPDTETPAVETVYIIQTDSTDEHPPYTVFEFLLRDYLEAAVLDHPGYEKQRCPPLEDARAVWPAKGELIFETNEL